MLSLQNYRISPGAHLPLEHIVVAKVALLLEVNNRPIEPSRRLVNLLAKGPQYLGRRNIGFSWSRLLPIAGTLRQRHTGLNEPKRRV